MTVLDVFCIVAIRELYRLDGAEATEMTWRYMAMGPPLVWSGLRLALVAVGVTAAAVLVLLILAKSRR